MQLDQTSTRSNGGLGLGLYLCREVAGLLGGTLSVSESPGGGSCFTLTLPAAKVAPRCDLAGAAAAGEHA